MKTAYDGEFLFWTPEGPQLEYRDRTLFVADLNPEVELKWRVSPKELFLIGFRCLKAAVRAALKETK